MPPIFTGPVLVGEGVAAGVPVSVAVGVGVSMAVDVGKGVGVFSSPPPQAGTRVSNRLRAVNTTNQRFI